MRVTKTFFPLFVGLLAILSVSLLGCEGEGVGEGIKVLDSKYKAVTLVEDTLFPGVNGATIGADGALYVVHTGNGAITRVDLNTMKASTFVAPYAGVSICDDISSDDKGNLYVTGTTQFVGQVYRIDKTGMKTVIATGLKAPNGIQYNPRTGRLFITECFWGNRVFEIDPTGMKEPRLMIDQNVIPVPEGFGFDPDTDDLIVPDLGTGKILRIHPDTADISTIAEKFIAPVALKVGPDKLAYIIELPTGAVYSLTLDGKERKKIAQLKPGVDNLAITKDGRLFVTSYWDATIWEVATDGSGKTKELFPTGPNQPLGIAIKNGKVLISDAIMVRSVEKGKYEKTKLNAWATKGMPLPISLTNGPGDQVFWVDFVHGAVVIGNPATGKFKPLAGELKQPGSVIVGDGGAKLFVTEYGSGQVTEISLKDGAKKAVTTGLEGPVALTMVDNILYVAESKIGRISKVDPATGKKEVFLSGLIAKPGALNNDGEGNLLVLDGAAQKLYRIGTKDLSISIIATNLPISYSLIGSYPPVELPLPMAVDKNGGIYFTTMNRGLVKIQKGS